MDNVTRKKDYEQSANEYWRWVDSARNLSIAADVLKKKYKSSLQEIRKQKRGKVPKEFSVLAPMIYLNAKCLELYLKALYIKNGKLVTKNGKLVYDSHNLVVLSRNAGLNLNTTQQELLERLTDAIVFWGTYPVPKNSSKWRQKVPGLTGAMPIFYWAEQDNEELKKILKKIKNSLRR